jgi:glycosyltransferase involved in cell wall biosynthesis
LVLNCIDGVIAISENTSKLLVKRVLKEGGKCKAGCFDRACNGRVHTIYGGVSLEQFVPNYKFKGKNILTACRLVKRKGTDILIKAVYEVLKKHRVRLFIIGDGPERKNLEAMVASLGINEHVIFCGEKSFSETCEWYRNCDIFVLPSLTLQQENEIEGFGIVFIEAMASGKPVIGTNTGGIPSAVRSPWGLLVKPGDHLQLAEKINYLIEHPGIAETMGREGRKAVERIYNWKVLCDRIERIYTLT